MKEVVKAVLAGLGGIGVVAVTIPYGYCSSSDDPRSTSARKTAQMPAQTRTALQVTAEAVATASPDDAGTPDAPNAAKTANPPGSAPAPDAEVPPDAPEPVPVRHNGDKDTSESDASEKAAPDKDPADKAPSNKDMPEKDPAGKSAPDPTAKPAPAAPADTLDAKPAPSLDAPETAPEPAVDAAIPKLPGLYKARNDAERAAQAVLAKHCARCHQAGALEGRDKPAAQFGNILALDALVANPARVVPGNPDESRLFTAIAQTLMPHDLYNAADSEEKPIPGKADLDALRRWITHAKPAASACSERDLITPEMVVKSIAEDLNGLKPDRLEGTRYLSLVPLYNRCVDDAAFKIHAQAAAKTLNSLSRGTAPIKLAPVGPGGALLRFHLDDAGWTPELWARLIDANPYAAFPEGGQSHFIATATKTPLAVIRADWLSFAGLRAPLYGALLGLPDRLAVLAEQLGVDTDGNIKGDKVRRAGIRNSKIALNARVIEHHPRSDGGMFWQVYDFASNAGPRAAFRFPLGPGGRNGFRHDGVAVLFSLANGFPGYFLADRRGRRLAEASRKLLRHPGSKGVVRAGASCVSCHTKGVIAVSDELAAEAAENKRLKDAQRARVQALYGQQGELDKLIETGQQAVAAAMSKAGLDPSVRLNGVEPATALGDQYSRALDLRAAAAELGVKPVKLEAVLEAMDEIGIKLKGALSRAALSRAEFETQFVALTRETGASTPVDLSALEIAKNDKLKPVQPAASSRFTLEIRSDKPSYTLADNPVLTVRTNRRCYLTLVNVDGDGQATVIYPNKFQQRNRISADKPFTLPDKKTPFRIRLKKAGPETVIAFCSETQKGLAGADHNFKKKPFTELGSYTEFLAGRIDAEVERARRRASSKRPRRRARQIRPVSGALRFEVKQP